MLGPAAVDKPAILVQRDDCGAIPAMVQMMHSEHYDPNSKEEKNVFHTLQIPFSSWVFVSETQKMKFSNLQTLYLTDQS